MTDKKKQRMTARLAEFYIRHERAQRKWCEGQGWDIAGYMEHREPFYHPARNREEWDDQTAANYKADRDALLEAEVNAARAREYQARNTDDTTGGE